MVAHVWHGIIAALISLSLLAGCASSPYVGTGAAVGGGLGALTGAAIAHSNPWAGAVVGGLVGSVLGAGGGYLVQQRQQQQQYQQPSQGDYYPSQPGYGAPAPPAYGRNAPAPGPRYGYNAPPPEASADPRDGWVSTAPEMPTGSGYDNSAGPPAYSRAPQGGVRTPVNPAPYYSRDAGE